MPLLTQLNTLESSGLVRLAAVQPELEYLFRHALVQDAAYASLLRLDRKQLHLAICHAFEQLYPDQTDDRAATLAYHYEKAEDSERAAHYFRLAGNHARRSYANIEAIAFYQAAARLIEIGQPEQGHTDLAQLYEGLADLLELTGQHNAAIAQYDSVLGILAASEKIWRGRIHRKAANSWMVQDQHEAAFRAYDEAENALGQEPDANADEWRLEWLQLQLERNWLLYSLNKVEQLSASIERTRPVLEQHGTPAQQAVFFISLVNLSYRLHRYILPPEDVAYAEMALAAAQKSGDLRSIAHAQWFFGVALLLRSDLAAAEEHLQASLRILEQVGDMATEIKCLTYLVVLYRRKGNLAVTRQLFPRLFKTATEGQMASYAAVATAAEAWLAWREGQLAAAVQGSRDALEIWQRVPWVYPFQWQALWTLIAVTMRQEQMAEAIHYTQKLLSPEQQALPDDLNASLETGVRAWEAGQTDTARSHLQQAVNLAQAQGYI